MNPYVMLGSGIGTSEAASLSARLAAWHDAMVAHERRLRTGRTVGTCDDECPHVEARTLWAEAVAIFGTRASELAFLRSRAFGASRQSEELIPPTETASEAADIAQSPSRTLRSATERRSKSVSGLSEQSRPSAAEFMTLRRVFAGDVQRIQEQVEDLLDREDGLIVLFDGSRMVSYSQGFGVSPCQLELPAIVAGLLVVYFDWRAKLRRRVVAERDTFRKAA